MTAPMAGYKNGDFGTDVLVGILLRLPPSSRRRARLVCQHWRSAVDNRTPEMQSRAVRTLISVKYWRAGTGYVIDDLADLLPRYDYNRKRRWGGSGAVIGTCNGLICLCDDRKPGGAVTLANPVTGERLVIPPLPGNHSSGQGQPAPSVRWHEAYSFGYHPLTGRYKIVHVPCYLDPIAGCHDVVHVFTLGESSWRDVPLPAAIRAIGSLGSGGLVSVDGTTYWLAKNGGGGKVVSLDLGDERLHASPLPVTAKPGVTLTVVGGRLGVALDRKSNKTDVWVLEGRRWRRRYEVQLDVSQRLTSPHFIHGNYVLRSSREHGVSLCGHRLDARKPLLMCKVLRGSEPAVCRIMGYINRTFAYVETMEPLSVYGLR